MIPTEVQPAYEPAVVERYRFEARVHGVQQVETTATSTLGHVMREDTIVEQATAKEITHEDVEMVRRFVLRAAAVQRDGR